MNGFNSCHSLYTSVLLAVIDHGDHRVPTEPIQVYMYHVIICVISQL
ncbi:unnamed protein product, partial [Staurois parvus]